jgi:hypothetical protein
MAHKQINFIQASINTLFQYYDNDGKGILNREEVRELLNDICSDIA